ncbi:hypothetical protein [Pseudoalteromonas luteoviolacea]|uniref:Uncharacterized protein n=1 Tax=Pseudoalteromonas luteoviolacea (strain 2ta16) TaxID=1353533 RepID=V4HS55_PSEL2|nr:hypothetical protein [Pseudoalteromonas luteoviolacea]ESP90764.1 hypothetical protein PL2TA16_01868 [Pseudoalteromonas luteoviolacea 2ta16]KZN41662.1 hypothetical protein N483_13415 [Pseudoalteromonas luteoviolacea NCIMB 1944]
MKYTLLLSGLLLSFAAGAQVRTVMDPLECKQVSVTGEIAFEEAGVTNLSATGELTIRCPIRSQVGLKFQGIDIWHQPHRTVYCSLIRRQWSHYNTKPTVLVKDFTLSSYPGYLLQSVSASPINSISSNVGTAYAFECRLSKKVGNHQTYLGAYTTNFN